MAQCPPPPCGSELILSITLLNTALHAVGIFQNQEKVLNFKENSLCEMTNRAGTLSNSINSKSMSDSEEEWISGKVIRGDVEGP